jgi:hypothetical protein
MGVLCDVYIADRKRALKYSFRSKCDCTNWQRCKCWAEYAPKTYDCIESHRLYDHDFAQLLSVLRGKTYRLSLDEEFNLIKEFSKNGPWIQKVPIDLPKLLAAEPIKELEPITEAWVELMDGNAPQPIDETMILDYLKLLHKLCKKSVKKKQSMYLWTCL